MLIAHHKELPSSVRKCQGSKYMSAGTLGFVHYCASHIADDGDKADVFVEVFKTGSSSRVGCPAHRLREYLIASRGNKHQLRRDLKIGLLIKVWNQFAAGDLAPAKIFAPTRLVDIAGVPRTKIWLPKELEKQYG